MLYLPGLLAAAIGALLATAGGEVVGLVSPLILAVVLGVLAANLGRIPERLRPGLQLAATKLLRWGVILLGLRVALSDLAGIGLPGLVVVALSFSATFLGAQWLGRRLAISPELSLLIGTGYAICGVSAVAAMNGVVQADEEEAAYAVGLVTLAGSLSILVLPLLSPLLGLAGESYGAWVGGSVHDVAQTVATASVGGELALASAVVVKLTRVALLAPLVIGVTLYRRRLHLQAEEGSRPPLLPGFVAGFLLAVGLRSTGLIPPSWLEAAKVVEGFLFTMALVAVGAAVTIKRLRQLGGTPLALGMATWLIVAGMSYLGVVISR